MKHACHLILIKHSLPEIDENVPAREWGLSSAGLIRAKSLVEKLQPHRPELIFSSLEIKAQQTAGILAESLELGILTAPGLQEHDRIGIPFYSQDEFHILVKTFFERPDELVFGNETAHQALGRFRKSIEMILESHNDKKVAVVSHGTVISLFVSWLTGVVGYLVWKELSLPSFVELDIQNRKLLNTVNIT